MSTIKSSEPVASVHASSTSQDRFDKDPPESQKAAPKPGEPQEAGAVGKAQREQLPAKYDNAPPSIQGTPEVIADDRDKWPTSKFSIKELTEANNIRARTKDPRSAGVYVAGSLVTKDGVDLSPARLIRRGDTFLPALLEDQSIELKLEK